MARVRSVETDDRLVDAVAADIGAPAADLRADPAIEVVAVADSLEGELPAAGLLARGEGGWRLLTGGRGDPGPVVDALAGRAGVLGGGPLQWFVPGVTGDHRRAAARTGLSPVRTLFQMRAALPLAEHASQPTRAYEPERDRADWLAVNNRAFAWHPDQGGWSLADVEAREAEPWFDAEGFRLHVTDGRLDAFCWTKVHADHDPPLGEIYVIAVDPDAAGRGLGRQLTLAGLDHLAARGLPVAMLYVEADNEPGLALYRSLGFHVHHEDVYFAGELEA